MMLSNREVRRGREIAVPDDSGLLRVSIDHSAAKAVKDLLRAVSGSFHSRAAGLSYRANTLASNFLACRCI